MANQALLEPALGTYDVPLGRGFSLSNIRRRNSLYQTLIESNWGDYKKCNVLNKRQFVLINIVSPIKAKGGRFLSLSKREGVGWVDVTSNRALVIRTAMQALRDRGRKTASIEGE
jgi:hypothetical protein